MIISDSCFSMGTSHQVCQDYAATKPHKGMAAVSDGCSSSPDTDIGARALVLSALSLMQQPIGRSAAVSSLCLSSIDGYMAPEHDPLGDLIASNAVNIAKSFPGISSNSLDATLGVLCQDLKESDDRRVSVAAFLWGDGVIIHRKANGELTCYHQEYESGAPFYLSYRLSNSRRGLYNSTFDKPLIETATFAECEPTTRSRGFADARCLSFALDVGETALICTDGINQFVCDGKPVPWINIAARVCDFKRFTGEFLKARMSFFGRECRKIGMTHGDDFAVAALHNNGQKTDQD